MNKEKLISLKKKLSLLALTGLMTLSMPGCNKKADKNEIYEPTTDIIEDIIMQEATTEAIENTTKQKKSNNINNEYLSEDIYVVSSQTFSGDDIKYLAVKATENEKEYTSSNKVEYYCELMTKNRILSVNDSKKLSEFIDESQIKEKYTYAEIIDIYLDITKDDSLEKYPIVVNSQDDEDYLYPACDLSILEYKDENDQSELYLVYDRTYKKDKLYMQKAREYFTEETIQESSKKWKNHIPLCEFIQLEDRKSCYTNSELECILENARKVYHNKNVDNQMSLLLK